MGETGPNYLFQPRGYVDLWKSLQWIILVFHNYFFVWQCEGKNHVMFFQRNLFFLKKKHNILSFFLTWHCFTYLCNRLQTNRLNTSDLKDSIIFTESARGLVVAMSVCLSVPSRVILGYAKTVWTGPFLSKSVTLILAYIKMFLPFCRFNDFLY